MISQKDAKDAKVLKEELLALAVRWREKAERIEVEYRASAPGQAAIAEAAMKTCAEELEEVLAASGQLSVLSCQS